MIAEEAKTLLSGVVTHLPDLWAKRGDSLIEFTRPTRNDFLTLVENDLITLDYLPDILDTAQTFVSGYYLSAVTLLVDIPEINIRRTLDQVSTRRDPVESILGSGSSAFKFVGTESFKHGLPALEHLGGGSIAAECFALEDEKYSGEGKNRETLDELKIQISEKQLDELTKRINDQYSDRALNNKDTMDAARLEHIDKQIDAIDQRFESEKLDRKERKELQAKQEKYQKERDKISDDLRERDFDLKKLSQILQKEQFEWNKAQQSKDKGSVGFGRDALATIEELSNLSTGKTLEVNFERNGNKAAIPVTIRLAVTDTDSLSMRTILSAAGIQNTFKERWRRMRNGELAMVKDLLFCHDLIAESRRVRIRDKSGFYEHMMRNQSKNFLSGLFSMNPSINNASAVLMVTEETAKAASIELGGSLDKFHIREKVFKSTAAMLLYVVDTKWDTVTIYHRGIDSYTTVTKRDIQRKKGKGGGSQVTDIINAYQAGSAPAI